MQQLATAKKKAACQLSILLRTARPKRRNFVDVISADCIVARLFLRRIGAFPTEK